MKENLESDLYEDLTERSKNVILGFGGVDHALNYFIEKGSFLGIRNCGVKSERELSEFFMLVNAKRKDDLLKETNFELFNQYNDVVTLYNILKKKLTKKARIVLTELESKNGCVSICSYFELIRNFILKGVPFLNDSKFLVHSLQNEFDKLFSELRIAKLTTEIPKDTDFTESNILTKEKVKKFEKTYLLLKKNLSQRAINILEYIEREYGSSNSSDLSNVILQLITKEINFYEYRNAGVKSVTEIQLFLSDFKEIIQNKFIDISQIENKNSPFEPTIKDSIRNLFSQFQIKEELLEEFIKDDEYDLLKLSVYLIWLDSNKSNKKSAVLKLLFFTNSGNNITLTEIADKIGLSKERVRQIRKELENGNHVSRIIKIIKSNLKSWSPINQSNAKDVIDFNNNYEIDIFNIIENIKPTKFLFELIYIKILDGEYILINNLIKLKYRGLKNPDSFIFFKNNPSFDADLIGDFFEWVDVQIINFELSNMDYNLSVLVHRYFQENGIKIEVSYINHLAEIVKELIVDFSGTSIERKGIKNKERQEIIELIRDFISIQNKPVKTSEINDFLVENYIERTIPQILFILNNAGNYFTPFGHGLWALCEWEQDGLIGGSLRDIIVKKLNSSNIPIHISEIVRYINQFHITNERNVLGNIRQEESGSFVRFNCGFIGLSSKRYDKIWFDIPKVQGSHFSKKILIKERKRHGNNLAKFLSNKYGYPIIHIEYLLSKLF
jgi:hypothetical protein